MKKKADIAPYDQIYVLDSNKYKTIKLTYHVPVCELRSLLELCWAGSRAAKQNQQNKSVHDKVTVLPGSCPNPFAIWLIWQSHHLWRLKELLLPWEAMFPNVVQVSLSPELCENDPEQEGSQERKKGREGEKNKQRETKNNIKNQCMYE